ncbi:hypothetical protein GE09DRAFT_562501 [Coniochaeta sp. 2T2.1]|nr:hypothetical protein GE09DRAFT_562501 [Coniochaeta sp. 2T2.1]
MRIRCCTKTGKVIVSILLSTKVTRSQPSGGSQHRNQSAMVQEGVQKPSGRTQDHHQPSSSLTKDGESHCDSQVVAVKMTTKWPSSSGRHGKSPSTAKCCPSQSSPVSRRMASSRHRSNDGQVAIIPIRIITLTRSEKKQVLNKGSVAFIHFPMLGPFPTNHQSGMWLAMR